jgi:hypothetical protein
MAIALDATATSAESATSTLAWNHVVGAAGANRLLSVGIVTIGTSQPTVTAVTFDGVAMTKARADQVDDGEGSYIESSVWILKNPNTGTKSISATITNNEYAGGVSASYTGCSQTSVADAVGGKIGTTSAGSQSFTVTTVADNCWIFAVGTGWVSCAAKQTSRGTVAIFYGELVVRGEDTNAAQTPAGEKTMGFTLCAYQLCWAMSGASFAPVAAASISIPVLEAQYCRRRS